MSTLDFFCLSSCLFLLVLHHEQGKHNFLCDSFYILEFCYPKTALVFSTTLIYSIVMFSTPVIILVGLQLVTSLLNTVPKAECSTLMKDFLMQSSKSTVAQHAPVDITLYVAHLFIQQHGITKLYSSSDSLHPWILS